MLFSMVMVVIVAWEWGPAGQTWLPPLPGLPSANRASSAFSKMDPLGHPPRMSVPAEIGDPNIFSQAVSGKIGMYLFIGKVPSGKHCQPFY